MKCNELINYPRIALRYIRSTQHFNQACWQHLAEPTAARMPPSSLHGRIHGVFSETLPASPSRRPQRNLLHLLQPVAQYRGLFEFEVAGVFVHLLFDGFDFFR